jgi:hypothetical protein
MPLQANLPRSAVNVPGDYFSMAGFEVTLYGRIWVSAEAIYADSLKLYPIGVFDWIWSEVKNSEPESDSDFSRVARLFKTPTEELVKLEPSKWQATFSEIHGEDLRLLSNSLINLSVLAARMSAYIDARGGEGGKDRGHVEAVNEQNRRAEKVRAVFGFQHPKADIDIPLS